jgi:arylsulfatase A-like enzyme
LAHSFDNEASAESKHHTQYFEMFGHRSLYHEGWKAVCPFPGPSFAEAAQKERYFGMPLTADLLNDLDAHGWELYNVVGRPGRNQKPGRGDAGQGAGDGPALVCRSR